MSIESVSVFFPCYNDSGTIEWVVMQAVDVLKPLDIDYEVIVVDDGSKDTSLAVLREMESRIPELRVVVHEANQGYGAALRSGFDNASYAWVFYTDGDGQYDPAELADLVAAAGPDVDIVQGYKIWRADGWGRRIVGRAYHHAVALLFRLPVRDTDCDFRLIRRSALDQFDLTRSTGVICVELMRKLHATGARFEEVPVHHYPRRYGTSRFFRPVPLALTLLDVGKLWVEPMVRRRIRTAARSR